MNRRLAQGEVVEHLDLRSIRSAKVMIPNSTALTHLQFRRFAGCPVCDLHLHSIAHRHEELVAASIREVAVFHSSEDELMPFCGELPFETIADSEKRLYRKFGIQSSPTALFTPSVSIPIVRGVLRSLIRFLRRKAPLPSLNPNGGRFGLPADFLIGPDGTLIACHYGAHAYDQWSVDEILALSRAAAYAWKSKEACSGWDLFGPLA